jgi:hypothetical protein
MSRSPSTQYIKCVGIITADSGQGPLADGFKKLLDVDTIPKVITVEPVAGANPTRTGRQ